MKLFKTFLIFALFSLAVQSAEAGWRKIESGTLGWLRAVYFLDEKTGWITGSQGTFLKTEDGGKTWRQAARFTEDKIRDVYFADAQTGWILCERDRFASGKASLSYLMKTTDGGANWKAVEIDKGRVRLSRLFFDKKGFGYAVGEGGFFYALQDDRQTWKKSALPVGYLMLAGAFPGEFQAALVGGGGTILFTDDAGMSWNKATLAGELNTKLNSVFFINQRVGWTAGAAGKIFTTSSGGRFWREQNSGATNDLTDIFFRNTAEGFAVGDGGVILHTTTAGNIWNAVESGVKHRLERIFFAGSRGFAVGFGGTILVYEAESKSETPDKPQARRQTF